MEKLKENCEAEKIHLFINLLCVSLFHVITSNCLIENSSKKSKCHKIIPFLSFVLS